jgi:hypothetical protein
MWTRPALLGATVLAFAAACSLTTSLSGLSSGDPAGDAGSSVPEGGDGSVTAADATADATSPPDGGASAYAAAVLADSPLAYYRFDDTGSVAKDETGAHDGTYKGSVPHVAGAIVTETGKAAFFDGSTYVDVGDVLPFLGDAPFTIEAWASPVAGATEPACIAAKSFAPGGLSGNISDGYTLYADTGTNKLNFARIANDVRSGPDGSGIANDRFTHVVATYDGTTAVIFVDGEPTASQASGERLVPNSKPLTLGAGRGGIYCYFHGALDEVALYGAALSAARIKAHYLAGIAK